MSCKCFLLMFRVSNTYFINKIWNCTFTGERAFFIVPDSQFFPFPKFFNEHRVSHIEIDVVFRKGSELLAVLFLILYRLIFWLLLSHSYDKSCHTSLTGLLSQADSS
uniref:Uncharacterized protein n=1 Tax=Cacopsylla melanoneura TaxID=428564 RepID=A0A8D9FEP2_9HEMI